MSNYHKGTVAANVLIGFDTEAIFELFNSDSDNFGDITGMVASNPNLFLFGYGSPRNVLQMEHTYGVQSNSAGEASTFRLKFIDPEVEFENRFIKNSSMQAAALSVFGADPDLAFKTKEDFLGSEYGTWWEEKYGEKYEEAKANNELELETVSVTWGPEPLTGETKFTGRKMYNNGDLPGFPTGAVNNNPIYHELNNYSEYIEWVNAGKPGGTFPTKWRREYLVHNKTKPNYPWRFYHKVNQATQEQQLELEEQVNKELREAIKSQQNLLKSGVTSKVFIAYGMGYDLKSWAGPFVTTLMNATNDYDAKGVRSLAIELVANVGNLGSGAREGRMSAGFGRKARIKHEVTIKDFNAFGEGELQQISSEKVAEVVNQYKANYGEGYAQAWLSEHTTDGTNPRPYRFLAEHVPGDLHDILTAVISRYVTSTTSSNKIPAGNVVVLIPDMDKGLASVQAKCLTDVLTSNAVRENNEGNHWDMDTRLFGNPLVDTTDERNAARGAYHRLADDVSMKTVWGFQVFKKMIEMFGLEFAITHRTSYYKGGEGADNSESPDTTQKYLDGLSFSAYKEYDPYDDWGWDNKNTDWSDSLLHFFGKITGKGAGSYKGKTRKIFEVVINNRYDENFEETLYRVLQDISSNSNITFQPTLIWEQDIQILKLLSDHGVIATDKQPAVLVGDKRLIDHFVYGSIEFQNIFKQQDATEEFLKYVHPKDIERFSWDPTK